MIYESGQNLGGEHRVVKVLEGGMAYVYILKDVQTGAKTAAKTVREEFVNDPTMVARFRREMKIWVALGKHPNIVRAHSVRDIEANPFLFMEYIDGKSLLQLIRGKAPVPVGQLLTIAEEVAEGMNHVHNFITPEGLRGIIHRDITPGNIMLTNSGEIKVADFGLARATDSTVLTRTCDVLGTVPYISPEQFYDSREVDKRTDIYSFGAVLYHAACGVVPFIGDSWPDLADKIKNCVPVAPIELRKELPEPFSDMIMRCLAKRKEDRIKNFGEIISITSQLSSNLKQGSEKPPRATTRELQIILDAAEREAAETGHDSIDLHHMLLSTATKSSEPLASWLSEIRVDQQSFARCIRTLAGNPNEREPAKAMKFRRSTQRVIGLARTLAEEEGLASPHARHIVKALLQESPVREMISKAAVLLDVQAAKVDRLFQLTEKNDR